MNEFSKEGLEDWEIELIEKYPLVFLEGAEPGGVNLRYGFEFHKGWAGLVDEFCTVATQLVERLRAAGQPDAFIHACIWKEKYGTMRWQGDDNLIEPFGKLFSVFVDYVEYKSTITCELTGRPGKPRNDLGRMKILCEEEYRKIKDA